MGRPPIEKGPYFRTACFIRIILLISFLFLLATASFTGLWLSFNTCTVLLVWRFGYTSLSAGGVLLRSCRRLEI